MHEPQGAQPRARSPFAAAFLSLLFPGLGQLYAGAPMRALAFAAAPILFIAAIAGVVLRIDKVELFGLALNPFILSSAFAINIVVLVYRLVAIVDAYRVTEYLNGFAPAGDGPSGPARLRKPLSVAGLLAVLLVMAASHVVVARYDMLALDVLGSDCIFIGGDSTGTCAADASASPDESVASDEPSLEPSASPTPVPSAVGTDVPQVTIPPWDGKERLNILLIGTDQRPAEGSYNTDTLIVVSIDPVSKQVAMFSLPRDTVDVPVPPGPAQRLFGTTYSAKINSWFQAVRYRSDLFPGTDRTRGYNGLKAIMGNLYGLDIKYFVEVNFDGFRAVVNAIGGVTVNVQIPVSDDHYPGDKGKLLRVYIPSGIQHMDGDQALQYARSRHGSSDFDRGQRQQRVLLSLREQTDPQDLIPRLPDLINALKKAVRTDIPVDQLSQLLGLASSVDTKDIRSYVFTPPLYQTEYLNSPRGYIIIPNVAKIRAAVASAFTTDPADEALREKLADEGAGVWVLYAGADRDRSTRLAGYLDFHGLAASAPRQKPPGKVPAGTSIVAYNGADLEFPATIAYLEQTLSVTSTTKTDPAVKADIVVSIGTATPDLQAPAGP